MRRFVYKLAPIFPSFVFDSDEFTTVSTPIENRQSGTGDTFYQTRWLSLINITYAAVVIGAARSERNKLAIEYRIPVMALLTIARFASGLVATEC